MFDIAFSELMIIAVIALIVIGPERLPKVARTAGHLFGRMQRYVSDVKSDISREMELEELKKLQTSMQEAARSFEQSVNREIQSTESDLNKIAQEANPTAVDTAAGASDAAAAALPGGQPPGELPQDSQSAPVPQMELELGTSPHPEKRA